MRYNFLSQNWIVSKFYHIMIYHVFNISVIMLTKLQVKDWDLQICKFPRSPLTPFYLNIGTVFDIFWYSPVLQQTDWFKWENEHFSQQLSHFIFAFFKTHDPVSSSPSDLQYSLVKTNERDNLLFQQYLFLIALLPCSRKGPAVLLQLSCS